MSTLTADALAETLASLEAKGFVRLSGDRIVLTEHAYEQIARARGFLFKSEELSWEELCRATGAVPPNGGSIARDGAVGTGSRPIGDLRQREEQE